MLSAIGAVKLHLLYLYLIYWSLMSREKSTNICLFLSTYIRGVIFSNKNLPVQGALTSGHQLGFELEDFFRGVAVGDAFDFLAVPPSNPIPNPAQPSHTPNLGKYLKWQSLFKKNCVSPFIRAQVCQ